MNRLFSKHPTTSCSDITSSHSLQAMLLLLQRHVSSSVSDVATMFQQCYWPKSNFAWRSFVCWDPLSLHILGSLPHFSISLSLKSDIFLQHLTHNCYNQYSCFITACAIGLWGDNCINICSCLSPDTECDVTTGCTECSEGWTGNILSGLVRLTF